MPIAFHDETFRDDYTYRNSDEAVRRFPFPFSQDEYMYSVNIELHAGGKPGSVYEHAFDIDEHYLPRSHEARGFQLHLTLLFQSELTQELARALLGVSARWTGRRVILNVAWVGSGGAAFLDAADPIASDAEVRQLHSAGYYASRGLHISL